MPRELLLIKDDGKLAKITIPDGAKLTFGPFSPPTKNGGGNMRGTLRVYMESKDNIIAVVSDLEGFRDVTIPYKEQIAKEEGDTIWKSDDGGYSKESRSKSTIVWKEPQLTEGTVRKVVKSKTRRKP